MNDTSQDKGQILAQRPLARQSFAERIWENKWTWAVGRTWPQHVANLGVYLALIAFASRKPPAAILERTIANWSPWTQEIIGDVFALLVTLPGYLTSLYVIACLTIHALVQVFKRTGKLADYFGADVLKGFLDHAAKTEVERRIVLDLTPQGGLLPIWVLFLFWPLTVYQWSLAGIFAAVALCLPGSHRFRSRMANKDAS
jgi:hypothetical protein